MKFTKLDLLQDNHGIGFDENSRDIMAFSTSQGLFQYKSLIFGVKYVWERYHS